MSNIVELLDLTMVFKLLWNVFGSTSRVQNKTRDKEP